MDAFACLERRRRDMRKSRLIVGIIIVAIVALLFAFGDGSYSTAGLTALALIGLTSIAISRRG